MRALVQGPGDESRGQRGEQPEQGERGRCGQPGCVKRLALVSRDPHPLWVVTRPAIRARHGLRRRGQRDRASQHESLRHQIGQHQRRSGVFGEEPRQQRPEPKAAEVGRGGDELGTVTLPIPSGSVKHPPPVFCHEAPSATLSWRLTQFGPADLIALLAVVGAAAGMTTGPGGLYWLAAGYRGFRWLPPGLESARRGNWYAAVLQRQ